MTSFNELTFFHVDILTNQKSRTVFRWILIGLNLHERM